MSWTKVNVITQIGSLKTEDKSYDKNNNQEGSFLKELSFCIEIPINVLPH